MASKIETDQVKFLISCIQFSSNGKVDFAEVAKECGIVSKGAAAKRYERLLKGHGAKDTKDAQIEKAKADSANPEASTPLKSNGRGTATKKRKHEETDSDKGEYLA